MKAVPPMLLALLALAPAAAAKGPHATVATGPTGIEPGRPWITTVTLFEQPPRALAATRVRVALRSGDRRITATPAGLAARPESGDQCGGGPPSAAGGLPSRGPMVVHRVRRHSGRPPFPFPDRDGRRRLGA